MSHAIPRPRLGKVRLLHRLAITILLTTFLAACGGGSVSAPSLNNENTGEPTLPVIESPGENTGGDTVTPAPVNKLVLTMPALADLNAGAEFDAVLSGVFTEEVYQGSCRLAYDSALLQPVSYGIGTFVPADMVTLADTHQNGFVPFAFTGLPGDPGISAGSGMLLTVRFRVLAPAAGTRVRFISDAEFLQLRDRNSQRLKFDVETVMEAAQ